MEIDLHAEHYKHYHLKSVPEKYQDQVDVRQFGPGERIVFVPYTAMPTRRLRSGSKSDRPSALQRLFRGTTA
jgi:hypothetical protein